jgi:hypothetical protein
MTQLFVPGCVNAMPYFAVDMQRTPHAMQRD